MTELNERTQTPIVTDRPASGTRGFLTAEAVLYTGFLLGELLAPGRIWLVVKYLSVLLCLGFAVRRARRSGDWSVAVPLGLTCMADALLLPGKWVSLGLCLFLGVQLLYARRIGRDSIRTLTGRLFTVLLLWWILGALDMATPRNLLAGVYFPQLLWNALLAWGLDTRPGRLFALGLTLFVGCDICVGLWNLPGLPGLVEQAAGVGMWLFYLPSQVCIVLSGEKYGEGH